MKKNKSLTRFKIFLLCGIVMLTMQTCRKKTQAPSEPVLPDITMTGANTIGCVVDGQIWLPATYLLSRPSFCMQYNAQSVFYLYLGHNHVGSSFTGGDIIEINYSGLNTQGVFDLTDASKAKITMVVEGDQSNEYGDSFTVLKGTLVITRFDLANKVISGQFSYTIKNNTRNITYVVTDGRFDITTDFCK